jgi:hypothetical protein
MSCSGVQCVWLCLVVCWLSGVCAAKAERARSALVLAPRSADPALIEVTSRVRGELSAAGFQVFTREAPAQLSPRRAVESAGADLEPSAVLWIIAAQTHTAAAPKLEIWLSDRLLGRVSMARLSSAAADSETPKLLAVHAVELLRARLSELRMATSAHAPVDAIRAADWVEQAPELERPAAEAPARELDVEAPRTPARAEHRFGVSVGLGYLFGSGSLAGALMPVIGLSASLGAPGARRAAPLRGPLRLDLRLSAAGFGERQRVRSEQGSVEVDQAYGTLSAALRFVTAVPIEPLLSLGAGVYTLGARGSAQPPYEAHHERYWAPLGSFGIGLRSRPIAHLSLTAAAELLAAGSRAELRIAGSDVARAGGAMWLVRAALQGVF